METTNGLVAAQASDANSPRRLVGDGSRGWLSRRRGPVAVGALTAAAVALALSQHWVAIADLVPLAYVLPCAAMMFMCMRGGMSQGQQAGLGQVPAHADTPTATDTRN
ncbi:hypothetical protein SAMN05444161_0137 [Rhizobiales bacterium GAS191]|jgi:hypothetical protein|nr:hypothetical protein SAMN05519103_07620 [Rhizobiales bacterium GAS113]SEB91643.1 hypothetical protein SAMN05444161_0137 [Rhizobiales bacterium GAS191]SED26357.1 hypothetical protein SAMN05519104_3171 [Rhizobiales bacterium GAS188]